MKIETPWSTLAYLCAANIHGVYLGGFRSGQVTSGLESGCRPSSCGRRLPLFSRLSRCQQPAEPELDLDVGSHRGLSSLGSASSFFFWPIQPPIKKLAGQSIQHIVLDPVIVQCFVNMCIFYHICSVCLLLRKKILTILASVKFIVLYSCAKRSISNYSCLLLHPFYFVCFWCSWINFLSDSSIYLDVASFSRGYSFVSG